MKSILAGCLWLAGCTVHCAQPLQVTLANHPTKPRPAALVLARCGDERWQWVCNSVAASEYGVLCDGKWVAVVRP